MKKGANFTVVVGELVHPFVLIELSFLFNIKAVHHETKDWKLEVLILVYNVVENTGFRGINHFNLYIVDWIGYKGVDIESFKYDTIESVYNLA